MMMATLLPSNDLATATLKQLREVIAKKGDFPSISGSVQQIVNAMRDDSPSDFDLAQSVLSDFALTQKVIRLANSAMYAAFGGAITTVSRAIYVLGIETVGHLALGLKFIDQLDKAAGTAVHARAEFAKAMVAGTISRKVTEGMGSRESEESVVCTLLHNLGRLLVTFYLPEQWDEIRKGSLEGTPAEEKAVAEAVLGLSLHELGRTVARDWGLPTDLIDAMQGPAPAGDNPLSHVEWLASLANFSSECATVLANGDDDASTVMAQIASVYAPWLGLDVAALAAAAVAIGADDVCRKLLASGKPQVNNTESEKPLDSYTRLDLGLRDMEAMAGNAGLSTLAGLMIEAMHTSMGFRRVFVFLRNGTTRKVSARMALGAGARELMPTLSFDEAFQPDVFHFALTQNRPVFIEDVRVPTIQAKLPGWFKDTLTTTRSFVCIPLVAGNAPVGMVYGDWETTDAQLRVESHELAKIVKMRDVLLGALGQHKQ